MTAKRIAVVGAMNMDLVSNVLELPNKGESVLGSSISELPGGKGANQAVAAALVGGDSVFISMRGDDAFGESLIESVLAAGVDVSLVGVSTTDSTGTAMIVVDSNGDNMITISPGANTLISPEIARESLLAVGNLEIVSVCGELPLSTIRSSLETAREVKVKSVLNLSPYNPSAIDLLALTSVLVVNQHEAAAITGIRDPQSNWPATMHAFKDLGSTDVVVTLGENGAVILNCAKENFEPVKIDAVQVTAMDTTGCGDAFTGALCVELALGNSLEVGVGFAVQVAGYAAASAGAQVSYGTRAEVLAKFSAPGAE